MKLRKRSARLLTVALAASLTAAAAGCGPREQPATDTAAVAPTALRVNNVSLGRAIGADNRVTSAATEFGTRDTIYAVVETNSASAGGTLAARWKFEDGQTVDESTRTVPANTETVTEFHISNPNGWPVGRYTVEIMLDGAPARTETFTVR
ncbi:MAG TPA: hypothetical protein VFZ56_00880 [Gemmatimonadaceae bacterium]